jgi:hypothetical protein
MTQLVHQAGQADNDTRVIAGLVCLPCLLGGRTEHAQARLADIGFRLGSQPVENVGRVSARRKSSISAGRVILTAAASACEHQRSGQQQGKFHVQSLGQARQAGHPC